ncbi:flagellar basal body-associated FliL family protein [Butyrivibrio sp. MC2021]|uniref:flagellar basal body-associated FliL family protein n=1 Tax=Butyrivibrio sp. MC2021 TaxID=1408306 RepID=UPI000478E835|nr:flagellar basal body-associated FliL family protein [Butyrivibrio sp. MC2021]
MKKNLLSIIILALLVVNLAMSGFMLLSVMSTNSQTTKLISDIAAALELEASGGAGGGFAGSAVDVGVANLATFELTGDDKMTINLKAGADGKTHYMVVEVVFSLNTANADYATLGSSESMAGKKSLIKAKVQEVLSSHTMEEIQTNESTVKDEILEAVQDLFGSNFIYDVSFASVLYQ